MRTTAPADALPAGRPARAPGRATGTAGLTAAGLSLIAVGYGLARFAYGLFVPAFRNTFGLDAATAGTIASSSYAAYCLAICVATVLTPRLGSRAVAVLAGLLATVGTGLIGLAPNAAVLAVGVVLAGSSTGVASPPLAHAVAGAVAVARRDRVQTVVNAGTGLGVLISGPVALLAQDQWRIGWLVFAAICAAVTIWVGFAVPSVRDRAAAPEAKPALLPRPPLPAGAVRLLTTAAVTGAASAATWTFGRDLLTTTGNLSDRTSTIAWILLGAFGLLGAVAGDLAVRVGVGRAWSATVLTLAGATALLALAPGSAIVAGIAAAGFGAAYIALTGLLLVAGTRTYPRQPAAGVGLAFLTLAVGQAAGAPTIGLLIDTTGPRTAFWTAALVALLASALRPYAPGTDAADTDGSPDTDAADTDAAGTDAADTDGSPARPRGCRTTSRPGFPQPVRGSHGQCGVPMASAGFPWPVRGSHGQQTVGTP